MNILLMGPPGSGKGTQAQRLAAELGIEHLAMGDLLRAEVDQGTELGARVEDVMASGELVSDALIFELMGPRLLAAAAPTGYLLDGFPRSTGQAEELQRLGAPPDLVITLDVPEAVLANRILDRAKTEARSDDNADVIATRLRVFASTTSPVLDFYRRRGLLRVVDGIGTPDAVSASILAVLRDEVNPSEPVSAVGSSSKSDN
jgi:adenylate kinase